MEQTVSINAEEINNLYDEVMAHARTTLAKAIRLGEMLWNVRQTLKARKWQPFVKANLKFSLSQADLYLRLYKNQAILPATTRINTAIKFLRDRKRHPEGAEGEPREDNRPILEQIAEESAKRIGTQMLAEVELKEEQEVGITYEGAKERVRLSWQRLVRDENEKATKHLAYVYVDYLFKLFPHLQDEPFEN